MIGNIQLILVKGYYNVSFYTLVVIVVLLLGIVYSCPKYFHILHFTLIEVLLEESIYIYILGISCRYIHLVSKVYKYPIK